MVPDDVGGRFSVLTAVGLLPLAAAGVDIEALMGGAAAEMDECLTNEDSAAVRYAAARQQRPQMEKSVRRAAVRQQKMRRNRSVRYAAARSRMSLRIRL